MNKKKMWKRCLCFGLALAMLLQVTPLEWLDLKMPSIPLNWLNEMTPKKAEAANPGDDVRLSDLLTEKYIGNDQLRQFIKTLVAKRWNKDENKVTIEDFIKYDGEIILNEKVGDIYGLGYARSATKIDISYLDNLDTIGAHEFNSCGMETFILPPNVKNIESHAFTNCSKLKTIVFPDTLKNIRSYAFSGCESLNGVTLPNNIETIENDAFSNCKSLTSIKIPNSSVTLGSSVFMNCEALKNVTLHPDMEWIPNGFFRGTKSLKSLTFPSKINRLEDWCFDGSGIVTVDLSECKNLKRIGRYAFGTTWSLSNVQLPEGLETIDNNAFNASGIQSIELPEGLLKLGSSAFQLSNITSIYIPSTLREITYNTFSDCPLLMDVRIGSEEHESMLEKIGDQAFYGCYSLPGTGFLKNLKYLEEIGNRTFANCNKFWLYVATNANSYEKDIYGKEYRRGNFKVVELPSSVKKLGDGVFEKCYLLEKALMGNNGNITELPQNTFADCENLIYVDLPKNLEKIGTSSFKNCKRLTKVDFPENTLTEIGDYAFQACGRYEHASNNNNHTYNALRVLWMYVQEECVVEYNDVDELVNDENYYQEAYTLADEVYEEYSYKQSERLYIRLEGIGRYASRNEIYIKLNGIMEANDPGVGYVKVAVPVLVEDYGTDSAPGWLKTDVTKKFKDCQTNINNTVILNYNDGERTTKITNNYAGVGNVYSGLEEVRIPNSVNKLGKGVFRECVNLKEVVFPDGVTAIPEETFYKCGDRIRLLDSGTSTSVSQITGIVSRFAYLGIEKVAFPTGLKEIGKNAFLDCKAFRFLNEEGIEDGKLPDDVTTIGESAFSGCSSISKIVMPYEITTIGKNAFYQATTMAPTSYEYTFEKDYEGNMDKKNELTPEDNSRGLLEVNFEQAGRLTSIGDTAFAYTPIRIVNLTSANRLKGIHKGAFKGCRWLSDFTANDNLEYIYAEALSSTENIQNVSFPATTVLSPQLFTGNTNRWLTFKTLRNDKVNKVKVALDGRTELPFYAMTETVGTVKGNQNGDGLWVTLDNPSNQEHIELESTVRKTLHSIPNVKIQNLVGKNVVTDAILNVQYDMIFDTVGVQYVFAPGELEYLVSVTEKPCESITFPNEPYRISVTNKKPSTGSSGGVELSAVVDPEDTTDEFEWTPSSSASDYIDFENINATSPVTGAIKATAKAKVWAKNPGRTEINLKVGQKQESCFVEVLVPLTNFSLTETSMNLKVGESGVIACNNPTYATGYSSEKIWLDKLKYTSSDESIATVDGDGKITAVSYGEATITAKPIVGTASAKTCKVVVVPEATDVLLSYQDEPVYLDIDPVEVDASNSKTIILDIETVPENSLALLECSSSDESVIKFSKFNTKDVTIVEDEEDGENSSKTYKKIHQVELTALKPGKATISVYPKGYGKAVENLDPRSRVTLDVKVDAYEITLNNSLTTLNVGETKSIFGSVRSNPSSTLKSTANINDVANITSDIILFTSSSPSVAMVDPNTGMVTGMSAGEATITVTSTSTRNGVSEVKKASKDITVKTPNAKAITINGPSQIEVGQTQKYTYTLDPIWAEDEVKFIMPNTSDASILKVTEDGYVTGIKKGSGTIRAVSQKNSSIRKDLRVTVTQPVTSIQQLKDGVQINVGAAYTLAANKDYKVLPDDASSKTLTWTSQNPGIATVSKSGQIKGIAKGETTVTGTSNNGKTINIPVTVISPVTKLELPTEVTLNVGGQTTLNPVKTPADASEEALTWKSSNESVAKVNESGIVTAIGKGTCNITVATASKKSASCKVTVNLPARSVKIQTNTVNFKTVYLAKGKTLSLKAVLTPSDTTDKIKWTSSKKKVATVVEGTGLVAAKKKGTTTITAKTTSGKRAKIKIIVVNKPTASKKITITKKKTLKRNKTIRITPKITSKKSTDTVTWQSSNNAIATVDSYGNITGKKKGKVNITVTTSSGKKATCKITVK